MFKGKLIFIFGSVVLLAICFLQYEVVSYLKSRQNWWSPIGAKNTACAKACEVKGNHVCGAVQKLCCASSAQCLSTGRVNQLCLEVLDLSASWTNWRGRNITEKCSSKGVNPIPNGARPREGVNTLPAGFRPSANCAHDPKAQLASVCPNK